MIIRNIWGESLNDFEVLCVTMNQEDFSNVKKMNLQCNAVFANQSNETNYHEKNIDGHIYKMISTATRGVGINRNLSLMYASAPICLLADDDIEYYDGLEGKITNEFMANPDADIIIFNVKSKSKEREQRIYNTTHKYRPWQRMPWGAVRIAFRLDSIKKANLWFTTLFGGGALYPSGEDSMWLTDAKKRGLTIYVSKETIGEVNFSDSSWFTGFDHKFFWGKGAFFKANHPRLYGLMILYFMFRSHKLSDLSYIESLRCMKKGVKDYINRKPYIC